MIMTCETDPLSSIEYIWRLRSRISAEARNMADLNAVGGRLVAEVNGFSLCKPPEILHSLKLNNLYT